MWLCYDDFVESISDKMYFIYDEISIEALKAAEVYSRTNIVNMFSLMIVLELLSFSNRFVVKI